MNSSLARRTLGILKRRHAPGTAPGTLPEAVAPEVPSRARLTEYGPGTLAESELRGPHELDEPAVADTCWLDVEGLDVALVGDLGTRLDVHPLALEDVVNVGQRPKVDEYDDFLFVVLEHFFLSDGNGGLAREQVSLVLQDRLVLSVREHRSDLFEPVRARLRGGKGRIRGSGAGYLAYALVDTVVDNLFPVLEDVGERIEELELSILSSPDPEDVAALHRVKRDLLMLRKSVWPLRDMLGRLQRSDTELISSETRLYLRDAADHTALALDIVETYREMATSLMDLYLSSVSNRMNEVMKVLTIIATIFIPLSFVAGLYGMNFDQSASPYNMPELSWYWGYPAALAVMALIAAGLLVFFRRRGWI